MSNMLQVRVNQELLDYFKGEPDKIKEALTLYLRSKQKFIEIYESIER